MFGHFNIKKALILEVETSETFQAFEGESPNGFIAMDIVNNTGVDIEYRRGGEGASIIIPDGSDRLVLGVGDVSTIEVKAVDGSVVTVTAEAFVV